MKEEEIFDYLIHEIKNSSQSIVLSAGILKKLFAKDEIPREAANKLVKRLSGQAEALYDQVRDAGLYFRDENYPDDFDLHSLINDIIDEYSPYILSRKLKLETEYDLSIKKIYQDEFKIRTMVINILKNSIEAAPSNSRIKIRTSSSDGMINISIENNGPRIPKERKDKIFDPLFTTKGAGTGLGLPIVKRFADNLAGLIEVESDEEHTVFIIKIPEKLK